LPAGSARPRRPMAKRTSCMAATRAAMRCRIGWPDKQRRAAKIRQAKAAGAKAAAEEGRGRSFGRVGSMRLYRIYVLESEDHVSDPPRIVQCADDDEAIFQARQYLKGAGGCR
jgi:hypothetical protein